MRSRASERQLRVGLWVHVICYVVAQVVQVVVWWLFTPQRFFWPLYSLVAWGVGLAFHFRAVSSPSRRD
ncbi:2TM domain-containing protein [Nonomuraea spiralis]|uniref:2TM domain-containing protein n=1 Tax=Nonomuraea spiralis TaxID=46182 RepID=A0ABV5IKE6_9ACTN|nr:2TM domain-containing protein [Nonomuraea spiralis]